MYVLLECLNTRVYNEFSHVLIGKIYFSHVFFISYHQINTNGLLSFRSEYPQFVNVPFPLEVPAVAPFYSNVDTSAHNDVALISYYQTHDPNLLGRAGTVVRTSFSDAIDFKAESLFIATWQNVGHYNKKNEVTNSFQV